MYLSILLTVTVLIVFMLKYNEMNMKQKVLAGVVILVICGIAMDQIKYQKLQENFENMQREEIEMNSESYEDLDEDDMDNDISMENDNIDNTYSTTNVDDNTMDKNNKQHMKQNNDNYNRQVNQIFNSLEQVNNDVMEDIEKMTDMKLPSPDLLEQSIANKDFNVEPSPTKMQNNNAADVTENYAILPRNIKHENKKKENFNDTNRSRMERMEEMMEEAKKSEGATVIHQKDGKGVSSVFSPQIIIKEDEDGGGVYMKSKKGDREVPLVRRRRRPRNWKEPTHDLWSDYHSYYNNSYGNRYTAGRSYNPNTNSGVDYETGRKTADPEYQNSPKTFYPGYSYMPPSNWDVPQKRPPVCMPNDPDTTKLPIGIADHGTPIFALEVDPIGRILTTEEKVKYTNVGSILPKFKYVEEGDDGYDDV
jgi:hypothetical protein